MSALARYFHSRKVAVSGYDRAPTPLTLQMEHEGISIHYEDDVSLLDKDADIVIYTPAIPAHHKEFNYYRDHQYEMLKRSEVLGAITRSTYNICIAGTHGKTTISTMVAYVLRASGFGCNAFLGGISVNFDTNFWSSSRPVSVVEADEYDRSFLRLSPDIAVITAMDPDHLDIYGTREHMEEAFVSFAGLLRPEGLLLTRYGLPQKDFSAGKHLTYSLQNEAADIYASGITMEKGGYHFSVKTASGYIENIRLNMGGMHNVENAVACIAIADFLGVEVEKIKDAIASFKGVKRRFEYIIDMAEAAKLKNNVIFIDDYAHHPEELNALIRGARSLFHNRKCTVIFQPHLFSRTRDLAKDFAASLDQADEVLLLPIYPARETPVEGVTSRLILEQMQNRNASVISKEDLLEYLAGTYLQTVHKSPYGQVLITAGAGDIDKLVAPIKKIIES